MSNVIDLLEYETLVIAKSTETSFISLNPEHIFCNNCDANVECVASLTFKISNANGVNEFTMPPMSSIEINQLGLLFGTSHTFSTRVNFDSVPGFEISFKKNSDSTVRISFLADPELLSFMGLEQSCSSIHATLEISDLPALEDSIRKAAQDCKTKNN